MHELLEEARSLTVCCFPILTLQETQGWTDDAQLPGYLSIHKNGCPCAVIVPTSFPILFPTFFPTCTGVLIEAIGFVKCSKVLE